MKVRIARVLGEVSLGIDGRRGARAGLPPFLPRSSSPSSPWSSSLSGSGSPPVLCGGDLGGYWFPPPYQLLLLYHFVELMLIAFQHDREVVLLFRRSRFDRPGLLSPKWVAAVE